MNSFFFPLLEEAPLLLLNFQFPTPRKFPKNYPAPKKKKSINILLKKILPKNHLFRCLNSSYPKSESEYFKLSLLYNTKQKMFHHSLFSIKLVHTDI